MGCFDTVEVRGGCECGGTVEFQSKGGDCRMETFDSFQVPTEVAGDCSNGWCADCDKAHDAEFTRFVEVRVKR